MQIINGIRQKFIYLPLLISIILLLIFSVPVNTYAAEGDSESTTETAETEEEDAETSGEEETDTDPNAEPELDPDVEPGTAPEPELDPEPEVTVTLDQTALSLNLGGSASLTVTSEGLTNPVYTWSSSNSELAMVDATGRVTANTSTPGTVDITVTAKESGAGEADTGYTATCTVTVVDPYAISLSQTSLTLFRNGTAAEQRQGLTLTLSGDYPADAIVEWSSSDTKVADVEFWVNPSDGLDIENPHHTRATVKAGTTPGTATITAKITSPAGNIQTAECTAELRVHPEKVTLVEPDFRDPFTVGETKKVRFTFEPTDTTETEVEWEVIGVSDTEGQEVLNFTAGEGANNAEVSAIAPGEAILRVTTKDGAVSDSGTITVNGVAIFLENDRITELDIRMGETVRLTNRAFGVAAQLIPGNNWTWTTTNKMIADIDERGYLSAKTEGSVVITCSASYNGIEYSTEVEVNVRWNEITMLQGTLVDGRMRFSTILDQLQNSSREMTGGELVYITNVTVPTEQGTLYIDYQDEPVPGAGVAASDRFYVTGNGKLIERIYFVPKPDFTGTAILYCEGYSDNGGNFTVNIYVPVAATDFTLRYLCEYGAPIAMVPLDLNNYCRQLTSRELSYVMFTLPDSSQGRLQYRRIDAGLYEKMVESDVKYYYLSTPRISDVWFVPTEGYAGEFDLSFTGYDTAGTSFAGTIHITVTRDSGSAGSIGTVSFTVISGGRVNFTTAAFEELSAARPQGRLDYVRFDALPDVQEGILYYDANRPVMLNSYYYSSGTAGSGYRLLDEVSFLAASGYTGTVEVPFTAWSTDGRSFQGTVEITVLSGADTDLYYTVRVGGTLRFPVTDFDAISRGLTGYGLNYIYFDELPEYRMGSVIYNGVAASANTYYYATSTPRISLLSFVPTRGYTGIVFLRYTACSTNGYLFRGTIRIEISGGMDLDGIPVYETEGYPVNLYPGDFTSIAAQRLNYALDTVTFNLPDPSTGKLYLDFVSPTRSASMDGLENFLPSDISRISFVPRGGFVGTAYLTYTCRDITGKSFIGSMVIWVSQKEQSSYFQDMGNYSWAVPAVDFLHYYGVVYGVDETRYSPAAQMRRGDFVLMLARAFNFPLAPAGTQQFADVPSNLYYAKAILAARALGVATADDEAGNFRASEFITRQEAGIMLFRCLQRQGDLVLGTEADLAGFTDAAEIAPEAVPALATLAKRGVFIGDNEHRLLPNETLSRAEMAQIIYRAIT